MDCLLGTHGGPLPCWWLGADGKGITMALSRASSRHRITNENGMRLTTRFLLHSLHRIVSPNNVICYFCVMLFIVVSNFTFFAMRVYSFPLCSQCCHIGSTPTTRYASLIPRTGCCCRFLYFHVFLWFELQMLLKKM